MKTGRNSGRNERRPSRFAGIATFVVMVLALMLGASVGTAEAGQVALAWDANTEPDLSGIQALLRNSRRNLWGAGQRRQCD